MAYAAARNTMEWDRREFDRQRYFEKKDLLLDYLGRECMVCGSSDFIEFDHINPDSKSFSIMARWSAPLEVLLPEIEKCQPLCRDCHKAKSDRSLVDHGEGTQGKRGCKCYPCRERMMAYQKARRLLHK